MGNKNNDLKKKRDRDRKINQQIENDRKVYEKEAKLLVLGTGDSGKSTFIKQTQLLFRDGFSEDEKMTFKKAIRINLIRHTKLLIRACRMLEIDLIKQNEEIADHFLEVKPDSNGNLSKKIVNDIKILWDDPAFKESFDRRSQFQIPDTAYHYFDNIDEVAKEDYIPSNVDILNCRIATSGVKVIEFPLSGIPTKIIDVGGQRSERRKWIHQFEDTTLVIYVVAISEYDQKLYEDESINRLHESLALFETTCKNYFLKKKDFLVLFNKKDIFKQKIKKIDLNVCFQKYKGGCQYKKATKYIKKRFFRRWKSGKRNLHHMFTIGTNTKNVKLVFKRVQEVVYEIFTKQGIL
ncbi:guanine nucleotide-binding protein g(o) subunit alpha [Anaeramoeba flamelloides]|uniref:Guanine nucleotide-binding protein g(O) subunit alpha n=1 Tax=Anaeramoeba flamelloides TaxID=1746091 RepID=A0ABQ8ZAX8_9EUKA|nr:guanine nucleotide-binding protein g(o) subunit alpha [Anaeramoeba flamelloides]